MVFSMAAGISTSQSQVSSSSLLIESASLHQIAFFFNHLLGFRPKERPEFMEVGVRPLDLFRVHQGMALPAANSVAAPAISTFITGLRQIDDFQRERHDRHPSVLHKLYPDPSVGKIDISEPRHNLQFRLKVQN